MTALRRCLRTYLTAMRVSLSGALQYRANVFSGLLFYSLFIYVFFCLWTAIYAGGSVEGFTFTQLIWYLCITELISYGARGSNICREITQEIKTGSIAYQLLRPYQYITYSFATSMGRTILNLIVFGILAIVLGFAYVGPIPGFALWTLPLSILSMLIGILLDFFSNMAIALTSFRIEDNYGVRLIYQKCVFMLGTFIPVDFLPDWMQGIVKNLPFSYVTWAPAKLTVAFSWESFFTLVPRQIAWLALAIGLSALLYQSGRKGIQSHGG